MVLYRNLIRRHIGCYHGSFRRNESVVLQSEKKAAEDTETQWFSGSVINILKTHATDKTV